MQPLLDGFLIVVNGSFSQVPCFTSQDILLETILKWLLSWEAHPHFLHKKALQNAKTGSTSQLFCGVGCASFCYFCGKWGLNFFSSKARVLPSYFRDSSTATATETVIPTMGLASVKINYPSITNTAPHSQQTLRPAFCTVPHLVHLIFLSSTTTATTVLSMTGAGSSVVS